MIRDRLLPALRRATAGDLQLLMLVNAVEAAGRFGAFVLYSRTLSPAGLGILASVNALTQLTSQLLQFGVDTSVISLGSKEFGKGEHVELTRILQTGFALHVLLGGLLAAVGILAAPLLAGRLFDDPALGSTLVVAFAGIPLVRFANFGLSALRTRQRFRHYAVASSVGTLLLVLSVATLYLSGKITVFNVVALVLVVVPAGQFLASLGGIPAGVFRPRMPDRERLRRILDFGKWIWGTTLLSAGLRRLNVLLLQELAGAAATGYFHTGRRYAEFLALIFEPLRKYLIPKLTALQGTPEIVAALRRTYARLVWTLLLLPLAWVAADPVIVLVQGESWRPAVVLFRILVVSRLLFFLAQPLTFALFAMHRPQGQTWVQLLAFVTYLAGALVLIPRWQALGGALSVLAASTITLAGLWWYVWRLTAVDRARPSLGAR